MSATKGDWRKLRKCLTLDSVRPLKKQRGGVCPNNGHLPSYTHVDFHLTGTPNCPMGAHRNVSQPSSRSHKTNKRHLIDHGVLNQQTMFIGAIPPVNRENIEAHLNRPPPVRANKPNDNNRIVQVDRDHRKVFTRSSLQNSILTHDNPDCDIQGDLESQDNSTLNENNINSCDHLEGFPDNDDDSIHSHVTVGSRPSEFRPIPTSVIAEVELMHLLRSCRCPLNLFKPIFEWAIKSQQRDGFDFANQSNARNQKKIIQQLRQLMQPPGKPPDCFQPVVMNWLPDNQPVEVHV